MIPRGRTKVIHSDHFPFIIQLEGMTRAKMEGDQRKLVEPEKARGVGDIQARNGGGLVKRLIKSLMMIPGQSRRL